MASIDSNHSKTLWKRFEFALFLLLLFIIALRATHTESIEKSISIAIGLFSSPAWSMIISGTLILATIAWFILSFASKKISYKRSGIELGAAIFILAAVVSAALFAGCSSTGSRGTAQNSYTSEDGAEVEEDFGDPGLARDLLMEGVRTERRDGRLFVQFNLRNTRPSNLAIEWAIVWLDSGGFQVDTQQHWTPAAMGGSGFETVSATAPTPEATGFRLGLRRPNTVH